MCVCLTVCLVSLKLAFYVKGQRTIPLQAEVASMNGMEVSQILPLMNVLTRLSLGVSLLRSGVKSEQ